MKIALGTVQFGLNYGAFNDAGRIDGGEAEAVLAIAQAAGITTLDTARSYGISEDVLGTFAAAERFRIITKIPALGQSEDKAIAVADSVASSLAALRTEKLDTLLFHSADDLLADYAVSAWNAAENACADGQVGKLGVTVYDAGQALEIANRFPIGLVQLPVSIFDQRALISGALDELKIRGIEIHARSVFLQGFALSSPDKLPPYLAQFKEELLAFQAFADSQEISALEAALGFVLAQSSIDHVVVGVQGSNELTEICDAMRCVPDLSGASQLASSNLQLLNPSYWATNGE